MKTFKKLTLATALLLGACGEDDSKLRQVFIDKCSTDPQMTKTGAIPADKVGELCGCMADSVEKTVGYGKMIEVGDDQTAAMKLMQDNPELLSGMTTCAMKIFTAK